MKDEAQLPTPTTPTRTFWFFTVRSPKNARASERASALLRSRSRDLPAQRERLREVSFEFGGAPVRRMLRQGAAARLLGEAAARGLGTVERLQHGLGAVGQHDLVVGENLVEPR